MKTSIWLDNNSEHLSMIIFPNINNYITVTYDNFSTCLSSNYVILCQALNKSLGKSWSLLYCEGWKYAYIASKLIQPVNSFHQELQMSSSFMFSYAVMFLLLKEKKTQNHNLNASPFTETNQNSGDILILGGWYFLLLTSSEGVLAYLLCLLQSLSWHLWPPRLYSV